MAQKFLKFNDYTPPMPDEDGYAAALATTHTSDSNRLMSGRAIVTPLFTVEAYTLKWSNISAKDVAAILSEVMGKKEFNFYHFNIYTAKWITSKFYAANFNMPSKSLEDNGERWSELSFQVTSVEAIH